MSTAALIVLAFCVILQICFWLKTIARTDTYRCFFKTQRNYAVISKEEVMTLDNVAPDGSALNALIAEINHYVGKTKGTTDFAIIQNKVERKLAMLHDQALANVSTPTHIGLMGTFGGVLLGLGCFLQGFDPVDGITDSAIKSLIDGVRVSMITSLLGLVITTCNNVAVSSAHKKVAEDKNVFYDFIQTELMPTLDVSLTTAIGHLHQTVDTFGPTFNQVINNFQTTFDNCTHAFGNNFEQHVSAVSGAVRMMGENMQTINDNIRLQQQILDTLGSERFMEGLDKYIEATDHFNRITLSLARFEKARTKMLEATQEAMNIQAQYAQSLQMPLTVAERLNNILDRISTFEQSVNALGKDLARRDMLGDKQIEAIDKVVNAIKRKGKVAQHLLEITDEKLEKMYEGQVAVIDQMSENYKVAIGRHIESYDQMMDEQARAIDDHNKLFKQKLAEKFDVAEVSAALVKIKFIEDILAQLKDSAKRSITSEQMKDITAALNDIKETNKKISEKSGSSITLFGRK